MKKEITAGYLLSKEEQLAQQLQAYSTGLQAQTYPQLARLTQGIQYAGSNEVQTNPLFPQLSTIKENASYEITTPGKISTSIINSSSIFQYENMGLRTVNRRFVYAEDPRLRVRLEMSIGNRGELGSEYVKNLLIGWTAYKDYNLLTNYHTDVRTHIDFGIMPQTPFVFHFLSDLHAQAANTEAATEIWLSINCLGKDGFIPSVGVEATRWPHIVQTHRNAYKWQVQRSIDFDTRRETHTGMLKPTNPRRNWDGASMSLDQLTELATNVFSLATFGYDDQASVTETEV